MKRVLIIAVALYACGCASIPVKQKATISLQSTERVLAAIQDTERQVCDPVKAAPQVVITECVGPTAAGVALTTARHHALAVALVKAYNAQIKAVTALQAWRSGDPAPKTLPEISAAVTEALTVVRQLTPASPQVTTWLSQLQAVLDQVVEINALLKGR